MKLNEIKEVKLIDPKKNDLVIALKKIAEMENPEFDWDYAKRFNEAKEIAKDALRSVGVAFKKIR